MNRNKKVIIGILIAVFIIVISVVGVYKVIEKSVTNRADFKFTVDNSNSNTVDTVNHEQNTNKGTDTQETGKVAVIYFSATGTTKTVAEYINDATNGDIIEIIPKEEYTSADLNYNTECRANREQNDDSARPEIENSIDVDMYDTIYLGYPIWWGDVPKIILTFLDTYELKNKNVIPFCTSGSTGISTSMNTLKNYSKNINWIEGKRLTPSSEIAINDWVKSINDNYNK